MQKELAFYLLWFKRSREHKNCLRQTDGETDGRTLDDRVSHKLDCSETSRANKLLYNVGLLSAESNHYLVPDCQVAREYLEILQHPLITGIIFLQTTVHSVQHEGSRRLYNRLKNIVKDTRKSSIIFHNEFQKYAYCVREAGEQLSSWQIRSTFKAAEWFYHHLAGQMPIIMVTQDKQAVEKYGSTTLNVFVMTLEDYLNQFWSPLIPDIMELYHSITASMECKVKERDYKGYLPSEVLDNGLKSGRFILGHLNVSRSNAAEEAFVRRKRSDMREDSGSDVLIHGMSHRNRAVHGDTVVVELLPRSEWRGKSMVIRDKEERDTGGSGEVEESSNIMPTGRIVGIVQRNWREYVASFAQDEVASQKGGRVLVIPWDFRIPKIRISTRQVDKFKDHRIVVRIDSWETDSQYPNGHFVKSLGRMGELETEIAAILMENTISVSTFSEAQMKELPSDTTEDPWRVEESEVEKRRDLRNSHLVFSIDPKGCEDVDDTLSVRHLPNGNLELGVHIADVTHFVRPGMLTDQEARSRSTTVYMADRRYDMLPAVLSSNLCSLISGVDRYAMSVIWELDSKYEVVDVWYGKTIIRSSYKLFYEMAQAIHDGMSTADIVEEVPELKNLTLDQLNKKVAELRTTITDLMTVARYLKSRRVRGGALELESVEVQVQLSETKSIQDLTPKDHLEVHETIAECMIFANHWVAKKIAQSFPNQSLLRHHPLPREEQFESLRNCAASRGFTIKTSSNKELAESLDRCVDCNDPEVNKLLRTLATQAMSNAAYFSTGALSRDQFFHYGLALDLYTHFTSPIRRYADVLVHRQLMAAVNNQDNNTLPGNKELDEISDHLNHQHRAAQNAQRDSQELFQCLFFKQKQLEDDCFNVDAVIFQLRANGVFVFVPRYGIRGPVYLRSKDGQVLHITDQGTPEWTGGTITKTDVKISIRDSWAHASSLKLDLFSNIPLHTEMEVDSMSAKQQRAAIVKEVSATAEETKLQSSVIDLGVNYPDMKAKYGQTSEDKSLYHLFESFKEIAKKPPDPK
ncbi:hypothetical protein FSP39_011852 [Pinctada imbricata]|uniref:DIS3-like exonuclease 1 n=1 Tax=Pinctada imbricata TaxID=66713 RepID=A0AA88XQL2_PINIB|nr:hypothetical protein FSP39_011852 [Pinctada imbricata]